MSKKVNIDFETRQIVSVPVKKLCMLMSLLNLVANEMSIRQRANLLEEVAVARWNDFPTNVRTWRYENS